MTARTLREHLEDFYRGKSLDPASLSGLRDRLAEASRPGPVPGAPAGPGRGPGLARRLREPGVALRLSLLGSAIVLTGLLAWRQDLVVELLAGFTEPDITFRAEYGEPAIELTAAVAAWVHREADEAWYREAETEVPDARRLDLGIVARVPGRPAPSAARWARDGRSYRTLSRTSPYFVRPDLMPRALWRRHRDGSGRTYTSAIVALMGPAGRALANHSRRRNLGDLVVLCRIESGVLQCLVTDASHEVAGWARTRPTSASVVALDPDELLDCARGPLLPFADPGTGTMGFTDPCGRVVVAGLDEARPGSEPLFPLPGQDDLFRAPARRDGRWEFVDRDGKPAFPGRFEDIGTGFGDRYCRIRRDGRWGLIDRTGREPFPPRFADGELPHLPGEGDWLPAAQGGRWGILRTDGTWLVEPSFDEVLPDPSGFEARVRQGTLWGILHAEVPPHPAAAGQPLTPVLRDPSRNDWATRRKEFGTKQWLLAPRYLEAPSGVAGRRAVRGPDGWRTLAWGGYEDDDPPVESLHQLYGFDPSPYDERIDDPRGNDYMVRRGDLWGLATWHGEELIPPVHDSIRPATSLGAFLLATGDDRILAERDGTPIFLTPLRVSRSFPENHRETWSDGWLPAAVPDPATGAWLDGWLHAGGRFVVAGRVLELTRRPPAHPSR